MAVSQFPPRKLFLHRREALSNDIAMTPKSSQKSGLANADFIAKHRLSKFLGGVKGALANALSGSILGVLMEYRVRAIFWTQKSGKRLRSNRRVRRIQPENIQATTRLSAQARDVSGPAPRRRQSSTEAQAAA